MPCFEYPDTALEALHRRDRKLAAYIERTGRIERPVTPDLFAGLIGSIIAQQISGKAAETVHNRLTAKIGHPTPDALLALPQEEIQSCGMSMKKAGYIQAAASAFQTGRIDPSHLTTLSDAEIIASLSALPGIGEWTAEMLLIFSLNRHDVLSFGDFGIRSGMCRLYGHRDMPRERFERYRKRFSPWGSVAALYFWQRAAEPA